MILILTEQDNGSLKKSTFELLSYGVALAKISGTEAKAIVIGSVNNVDVIAKYGVSKTIMVETDQSHNAAVVAAQVVANGSDASFIITAKSAFSDAVAARVAGSIKAAYIGNVTALPTKTNDGWLVKKSIFTGKAFANVAVNGCTVLGVKKNAIEPAELGGSSELTKVGLTAVSTTAVYDAPIKATGTVLLPEADKVVSGGRGMKGPEHWRPLLDLAEALGAGTACSKPVSDLDWRPHHEHVGQTGVKVAPNLYIACGISGAIQHLAGVNASKVIVVINKDPEAPFFKAADYGIVGDVFEVLPKLTAAVKAL